jgi:CheY-like chemotaxis protein
MQIPRVPDRRGFPRINSEYRLMIALQPTQGESDAPTAAIDAFTRDISRGGVGAVTSHSAPKRTRCLVRFFAAAGRISPDLTWGVVRRVEEQRDGFLVGIEFDTPLETLKLPAPSLSADPHPDRLPELQHAEAVEQLSFVEPGARPFQILIADDEEPIRSLLRRFLANRGYVADSASDGMEALRAIRKKHYDAVLLDLYLPKLSGLDLLKHVRDQNLAVGSIITMSGFDDDEARRQSFALGAEDFLAKPINLRGLETFLQRKLHGEAPN